MAPSLLGLLRPHLEALVVGHVSARRRPPWWCWCCLLGPGPVWSPTASVVGRRKRSRSGHRGRRQPCRGR
jgi:hypothetical protein